MQTPILLHKNYTLNEEGYQLKLPLNLETIIPVDDSVRLLSQFMEAMDLTDLYSTYERINTVYAVTKKEITGTGIKKMKQAHPGEEIGCVVLELGYFIDFENKALEDPLSVALSLTESEKQDERVNISINEMLEEYVW